MNTPHWRHLLPLLLALSLTAGCGSGGYGTVGAEVGYEAPPYEEPC